MARKLHVVTNAQRDARQLLINAAPLVGEFVGGGEIGVALTFADPEGKQKPSPRGVSYTGDMNAYFDFSCPMRDCTDGGFNANADLLPALKRKKDGHTGTLSCQGVRPRGGLKNQPCNIELTYTLVIRPKAKAAA